MLKNYAGARDDATLIPGTFRFNAIYSANSSRENNTVATLTTTLIRREAGVNPRFYATTLYTTDPRTPFRNKGDTAKGPDPIRQFVEQLKYPARHADRDLQLAGSAAHRAEARTNWQLGAGGGGDQPGARGGQLFRRMRSRYKLRCSPRFAMSGAPSCGCRRSRWSTSAASPIRTWRRRMTSVSTSASGSGIAIR